MVIHNNTIHCHGQAKRGIGIGSILGSNEVTENTIIDVGDSYSIQIHTLGADVNILRNRLLSNQNTTGPALRLSQTSGLIAYNLISNAVNGIELEGDGNHSIQLYNNTINHSSYGLYLANGLPIVLDCQNNIFYAESTPDRHIRIGSGSTEYATLNYNLYFPDGTGLWHWGGTNAPWSSYVAGSGQDQNSPVPADPLFVGSGDFGLQSESSPAFDAGVSIVGLNTDCYGVSVPQGGAPDIGAFEFVL